MRITSSAFENGAMIPEKYTCDGENISPPLTIVDIPKEAKSLVLIADDPDAPMGTWTHWIVWNITVKNIGIEENSAPGTEGRNTSGKEGYSGPCPPSGIHRYFFKVYALDNILENKIGASRKEIEQSMEGHVIAESVLMGRYGR